MRPARFKIGKVVDSGIFRGKHLCFLGFRSIIGSICIFAARHELHGKRHLFAAKAYGRLIIKHDVFTAKSGKGGACFGEHGVAIGKQM